MRTSGSERDGENPLLEDAFLNRGGRGSKKVNVGNNVPNYGATELVPAEGGCSRWGLERAWVGCLPEIHRRLPKSFALT
jgi:hypothetical protein